MPAPSGHRLYQTPTFTNCRLPKTMLLESSQAVLQIPIHNTFTRKPRRCLFPITSNFMHRNSNKSVNPGNQDAASFQSPQTSCISTQTQVSTTYAPPT